MTRKAIEIRIDSDGAKCRRVCIKRRIQKYYNDIDTGETVFVLYEDIDGYIHYSYTNFDTDKYELNATDFNLMFQREQL